MRPARATSRSTRTSAALRQSHHKAIYARRNVVERCINRLNQWRGLATRDEKRALNYRAMLVIASIVLWLDS
jgi:transposase